MNRRSGVRASRRVDAGRALLEAVVGLSLIALAVVAWGRAAVVGARAESAAVHRTVALEIAGNELESLVVRDWATLALDPNGPGFVRRFEGEPVVADPSGVVAATVDTRDGVDFDVVRIVTDPGDPGWRRLTVEVTWPEGEHIARVRLDGAALAPAGDRP